MSITPSTITEEDLIRECANSSFEEITILTLKQINKQLISLRSEVDQLKAELAKK